MSNTVRCEINVSQDPLDQSLTVNLPHGSTLLRCSITGSTTTLIWENQVNGEPIVSSLLIASPASAMPLTISTRQSSPSEREDNTTQEPSTEMRRTMLR